jgi:hypothetical protein
MLDVERQTNGDVVVEDELEALTGLTVDENGWSSERKLIEMTKDDGRRMLDVERQMMTGEWRRCGGKQA